MRIRGAGAQSAGPPRARKKAEPRWESRFHAGKVCARSLALRSPSIRHHPRTSLCRSQNIKGNSPDGQEASLDDEAEGKKNATDGQERWRVLRERESEPGGEVRNWGAAGGRAIAEPEPDCEVFHVIAGCHGRAWCARMPTAHWQHGQLRRAVGLLPSAHFWHLTTARQIASGSQHPSLTRLGLVQLLDMSKALSYVAPAVRATAAPP